MTRGKEQGASASDKKQERNAPRWPHAAILENFPLFITQERSVTVAGHRKFVLAPGQFD